MSRDGSFYFKLSRATQLWRDNPQVGFDLFAHLGRHADYEPGESLWILRTMVAQDLPEALRVIEHGGSVSSHDFGPAPSLISQDERKLVRLFIDRIDKTMPGGKNYAQHLLDRDLETALIMSARYDLSESLLQAA